MDAHKSEPHEVRVEIDGKHYTGSFTIDDGVVRVVSPLLRAKAAQAGSLYPENVARILLRDMVLESLRR